MNIKINSITVESVDISTRIKNQKPIGGWWVNYEVIYPIYLQGKLKIDTVSFSSPYADLIDQIEQHLKKVVLEIEAE
jgi:hypothetical protein